MSQLPIMDAGSGLNFFALNKERLLFNVRGALSVPEAMKTEMLSKAKRDPRFAAAERVWHKLSERLMNVFSDDKTNALDHAVHWISGAAFDERIRSQADLGETMVIAHAAVAAETGQHVIVLLDDQAGRRDAAKEARRLQRMHQLGHPVGSLALIQTVTVLEHAAGGADLPP